MGKWLIAGLLLISSVYVSAQDHSFEVTRDVKWKLVGSVNMSDMALIEADIQPVFVAPEPGMEKKVQLIKEKLDQQKKRKFARLDKNAVYDKSGDAIIPEVEKDFDGLPTSLAGIPNDNNMAISNGGMLVSVINSSVSMFNTDGDRILFRTLASIVGLQHTGLNRTYDPKILYDPDNDRFILVFLQGSTSEDTRIMVGFSQTNDPTKTWKFYAVEGNPFGGLTWSDYPIIGSSKEDLFITVNILRDNESWQEGFTQSVIWQIEKSGGYDGNDSLNSDLFHDLFYKKRPLWSICVVQGDKFKSKVNHFLTVRPSAESNDTLFVHTINNTWASRQAEYSLEVYRTNKPYGVPPSAFQPAEGYLLQTNDTRVLSAFEHHGEIQYVQTTNVPGTNMSGIFHGMLTVRDPNFLVHSNYISSDTFEFAYPSIAWIGDQGNPHASVITASHVSELHFAGTSCFMHNKVGNNGSVYSSNAIVKEGVGLINTFLANDQERWGDYSGIQRFYAEEGIAWMCGSYGNENERNSVWIGKVRVDNALNLLSMESAIRIYPNPSVDEFNLDLSLEEDALIEILLYDAAGQLIQEVLKRDLQQGDHLIRMNVNYLKKGSLRAGLYFIQIKKNGDETLHSEKLFIY